MLLPGSQLRTGGNGEVHLAVESAGALAGGIGIIPLTGERTGTAILGYWLGTAYWGRGIATQAVRLLSTHALNDRGFHRVEACVFAGNVASAKVLEKAGFRREAVLAAYYVDRDDRVSDGLLYARVAPRT